jgi:outer membrane lipoprotein-sorting protein
MNAYLIALALLVPQDKQNEAEELFKKLEEQIAKAATVQATLKGDMKSGPATIKFTAELLLGEGNRARWELTKTMGSRSSESVFVSDGRRVSEVEMKEGAPAPFETPGTFGESMRIRFARAGIFGALDLQSEKLAKEDPSTAPAPSDLKLGPREKTGGRDAQRVDYSLAKEGEPKRTVQLWIDLATQLPIRREVKAGPMTVTEEYTQFTLGGKVDAEKFELPKEGK